MRSDTDHNNRSCDSIDDTKSIDQFAGPGTKLIFVSGPHDGVRVRKDAAGNPVVPRQATAYWSPSGLRVGRDISNPVKVDKYAHGVFLMGPDRQPKIVATADLPRPLTDSLAVQAGPILVKEGEVTSHLDDDYPMGRTPRAILGITRSGEVMLVRITGEVTLEEAAAFMLAQGAQAALNLQGDSGAIFWFEGNSYPAKDRALPNLCEVIVVQ